VPAGHAPAPGGLTTSFHIALADGQSSGVAAALMLLPRAGCRRP
jgi:hypothetical protein